MKNFTKNVKLILFSNLIYLSISILLIATISSCSEKSDDFNPNDVVNKLSQMSDLGTVEFQFSKIMKADDEATWFKVGTRRILIKSKAYVKAGVDFSGIKITLSNVKGLSNTKFSFVKQIFQSYSSITNFLSNSKLIIFVSAIINS